MLNTSYVFSSANKISKLGGRNFGSSGHDTLEFARAWLYALYSEVLGLVLLFRSPSSRMNSLLRLLAAQGPKVAGNSAFRLQARSYAAQGASSSSSKTVRPSRCVWVRLMQMLEFPMLDVIFSCFFTIKATIAFLGDSHLTTLLTPSHITFCLYDDLPEQLRDIPHNWLLSSAWLAWRAQHDFWQGLWVFLGASAAGGAYYASQQGLIRPQNLPVIEFCRLPP